MKIFYFLFLIRYFLHNNHPLLSLKILAFLILIFIRASLYELEK